MNEVKKPKLPLAVYYAIAMLIVILVNGALIPMIARQQIKDVDYGTFMTMTESGDIGRVQVDDDKILFTNKDGSQIFRTGIMDDPGLVERLHASGAEFSGTIVEEMSPFMSFITSWILPILFFYAIGQFLTKKMMDRAGGRRRLHDVQSWQEQCQGLREVLGRHQILRRRRRGRG
ncbi:MAG: hypothetical protein IJK25_02275 [Firmicutes bacterium]|nr:hypothetical protein [Bacillota bacterium]